MKTRVIEVLVMEEAILIGAVVEMDRAHPARGPLSCLKEIGQTPFVHHLTNTIANNHGQGS